MSDIAYDEIIIIIIIMIYLLQLGLYLLAVFLL
jgi:hypothetical protein